MDDRQLLAALAGDNPETALAECIGRYGPLVQRTAWRITGDEHLAEDVCQVVFLVLMRKAGRLQDVKVLGAWLYRVAVLTARKVVEGKVRRRKREQEAVMVARARPDSITRLPTGIDQAVSRLPEIYRQVIVAHYLQGRSYPEVAAQLGVPEATAKKRGFLAINRLRKFLAATAPGLTVAALGSALAAEAAAAGAAPLAAGQAAAIHAAVLGGASTQAIALADVTMKALFWAKAKTYALTAAAVAAVVATTAGFVIYRPEAPPALVLADFDGPSVPVNKAGEPYPSYYFEPRESGDPGGIFTASIDTNDAVKGNSLRLRLTQGLLKAQFNPHGKDRWTFARDYVADPAAWRFNTYNRLTFWIKLPAEARAYRADGDGNIKVGTYCKRVADPHDQSDNAGGGHFYHHVNVPAVGRWTQVILSAHPHNEDGNDAQQEIAVQTHPTGEGSYNFFDTLTRFYIAVRSPPGGYPADYFLDEVRFESQTHPENDAQIYSIAATHDPQTNRLILTWSRPKGEDSVKHEVRYAFRDIHTIGWDKAQPAPRGLVAPLGSGVLNGMVYDTSALPLAGHFVVYVAIKPQNAELFSQIAVPLTLK